MSEKINLVLINLQIHSSNGTDRYIDMLKLGLINQNVSIHNICIIHNDKVILPQITEEKYGFEIKLPLPHNITLLRKKNENYWRINYFNVIVDLLTDHFGKSEGPLIWHIHNLFLVEMAFLLKKILGGKIIIHLHCLPWKVCSIRNTRLFSKLYRSYLKGDFSTIKEEEGINYIDYDSADHIICVSNSGKDYLKNIHNVDENKISVIYNGLAPIHKDKYKYKQTEQILFVGRLTEEKGIIDLLDTVLIVKNRGYNIKLMLAGSGSPEIIDFIKNRYKNIDFELLGHIDSQRLKELYESSIVGVLPSLHEQCSYVALEMARSGMSIIVSDVDALSEIFKHEETALLTPLIFNPDLGIKADKDKFADNIIRLIIDENLRLRLSNNIKHLFEENFTLDKMIKKTIFVYKEVIKK